MGENRVAESLRGSARGSLILLAGQAASTLIRALSVIIIARILGATRFGVVSKAYIPVSLAHILLNTGTDAALIKYLAQYRAENSVANRRRLMETGTLINLTVGTALTLITYLTADYAAETLFNEPELGPLIQLYSLVILGQALLNTSHAVLVGYERMAPRSLIYVFFSLTRSVAGPALVFIGLGPMGAVLGDSASFLLAGIVGALILATIYRSEHAGRDGLTHLQRARAQVCDPVLRPKKQVNYLVRNYVPYLWVGGASPRSTSIGTRKTRLRAPGSWSTTSRELNLAPSSGVT